MIVSCQPMVNFAITVSQQQLSERGADQHDVHQRLKQSQHTYRG
jgi:hypothetical protein